MSDLENLSDNTCSSLIVQRMSTMGPHPGPELQGDTIPPSQIRHHAG